MKKIILLLLIIPLIGSFTYGSNEYNHSLNISSTIDNPDFRGVWKDDMDNYRMIWIDRSGKYQYQYMDGYSQITETVSVELKGDKLIVETIFLRTNWEVKCILSLKDNNTIEVQGMNQEKVFNMTLTRVDKHQSK